MANYKDAGVDVEAGYKAVELMKSHVDRTMRKEVLNGLGGFGGLFELDLTGIERPVLVSGTDGVGTKLKIAFLQKQYDTVGIDCVAMCVNDIVCSGAKPLYFLDYLALGKNYPDMVESIVKGVAEGCVMAGCALIGGETAEMPGFYKTDEFDMAGFAVGVVDKGKIIDGSKIKPGDKLVGLASSGIHSNGFSLVRKIFNPTQERLSAFISEFKCTLGEELLRPTRIYVKTILNLVEKFKINGLSHITGGGFIENIPRMAPGFRWEIDMGSWDILPVFNLLMSRGNVEERDMYNTFNMGIGMVMAVDAGIAEDVVSYLEGVGEKAYIIGTVREKAEGEEAVCLK